MSVQPNAPASVTNTAMVSAGGDVNSNNNSASDPTTIVAVADLTLTKTHTGSFLQGQIGATYTLTVSNIGGGPTSGAVTVTDTVPTGLTPTAAAGAGWVCDIAGQAVSCTRADALNAGASYPAITLTVNVAPAAPPSLTNTARVSGGGEINTANNTARDITTIGPGADLTITKSHSGNFTAGTDRRNLYRDGNQLRCRVDQRRDYGHRQRSHRTGAHIRGGCRLDLQHRGPGSDLQP